MVEPVRHRQTKEAATDMSEPKATASHLDSTRNASDSAHRSRCAPEPRFMSTRPKTAFSTFSIQSGHDRTHEPHQMTRPPAEATSPDAIVVSGTDRVNAAGYRSTSTT